MSALPPIADIGTQPRDVLFVPIADIAWLAEAGCKVHVTEPHISGPCLAPRRFSLSIRNAPRRHSTQRGYTPIVLQRYVFSLKERQTCGVQNLLQEATQLSSSSMIEDNGGSTHVRALLET